MYADMHCKTPADARKATMELIATARALRHSRALQPEYQKRLGDSLTKESAMDNWLIKWNGPSKIKGIIAVRTVFGLGLKEAIGILSSEDGFVCTQLQWIALRGEYMLHATQSVTPGMLNSPDRFVNDWLVEEYKQVYPQWLCDETPHDHALNPSTMKEV